MPILRDVVYVVPAINNKINAMRQRCIFFYCFVVGLLEQNAIQESLLSYPRRMQSTYIWRVALRFGGTEYSVVIAVRGIFLNCIVCM